MAKPTYQISSFSEAVNYTPINIVSTVSATPTVLHTAHATAIDEIWLEAFNYGSTDALLTLTVGGTALHQRLSLLIPANKGNVPVLNGIRLSGSVVLGGYASITNTISVLGSINRIVFI